MALLNTYTNERTGLTVTNAYTIVTGIDWNKMGCVAHLTAYVSKAKRDEDLVGNGVGTYSIMLGETDAVSLAAIYAFAKTQPLFANATDA